MTLFWKKAKHRALLHQLERSKHLRTNITYKIKYPNECRNCDVDYQIGTKKNKDGKLRPVYIKVNPEAAKRITEEVQKLQAAATVPTVERPKRINRNG